MSHEFAKKMSYDSHSFGKKLSHPHNFGNKIHHSIKHFNHYAVPILSMGGTVGLGAASLLKGGEAVSGLMGRASGVSFDGQPHEKHRRPTLER